MVISYVANSNYAEYWGTGKGSSFVVKVSKRNETPADASDDNHAPHDNHAPPDNQAPDDLI